MNLCFLIAFNIMTYNNLIMAFFQSQKPSHALFFKWQCGTYSPGLSQPRVFGQCELQGTFGMSGELNPPSLCTAVRGYL